VKYCLINIAAIHLCLLHHYISEFILLRKSVVYEVLTASCTCKIYSFLLLCSRKVHIDILSLHWL
jgi:hypothetical protein